PPGDRGDSGRGNLLVWRDGVAGQDGDARERHLVGDHRRRRRSLHRRHAPNCPWLACRHRDARDIGIVAVTTARALGSALSAGKARSAGSVLFSLPAQQDCDGSPEQDNLKPPCESWYGSVGEPIEWVPVGREKG